VDVAGLRLSCTSPQRYGETRTGDRQPECRTAKGRGGVSTARSASLPTAIVPFRGYRRRGPARRGAGRWRATGCTTPASLDQVSAGAHHRAQRQVLGAVGGQRDQVVTVRLAPPGPPDPAELGEVERGEHPADDDGQGTAGRIATPSARGGVPASRPPTTPATNGPISGSQDRSRASSVMLVLARRSDPPCVGALRGRRIRVRGWSRGRLGRDVRPDRSWRPSTPLGVRPTRSSVRPTHRLRSRGRPSVKPCRR
jgi:hypothetical protein